jgi:glycosyltransferase involved in cell wall biosynthesis
MQVLQIHNFYQRPGGEDAVVELERELLISNGHECEQLTASNDQIRSNWGRVAAAIRAPYSLKARRQAADVLAANRPDIVHIHNTFPLLSPSIYDACAEAEVPVVQTLHNFRNICPGALLLREGRLCELCVTGSVYHSVRHGCYRGSRLATLPVAALVATHRRLGTWATKVDRFISLTNFALDKFVEAGFPSSKISVKPNFCVRPSVLDSRQPRSGALFVGRLAEEKGITTLVEAWSNLDIPLSVLGEGPLRPSIPESPVITTPGQVGRDEVGRLMQRAQFLVMPSSCYEGFPMVLVEAFSRGLPVLGSRLGGIAEIVEDGVTGLHFEAGNASDLAEKARWLSAHPAECLEMGRNARAAYEARYTPERNYELLMEIYQSVLSRKPAHARPLPS